MIGTIQTWVESLALSPLTVVGIMALVGLAAGKLAGAARLPSIMGYLVIGVVIGPSLLGVLGDEKTANLGFLTDVALGFVALSIGLELKLRSLRGLGGGIVAVILTESLAAAAVVTAVVYIVSGDLPLAILFGAVAPASAPAGTVAVIKEYRARGPLTQALYAVVGFDDGFGIIIFGFAAALARAIVAGGGNVGNLILSPLTEIGLSIAVGAAIALLYGVVLRFISSRRDIFILSFGGVLVTIGLSKAIHISEILTAMVIGAGVVNTLDERTSRKLEDALSEVMPLLFVLFFVLAGANLHVAEIPSLGLIGIAYIAARTVGLVGGSFLGGLIGKMQRKIRNNLGLGILSQAGVAIGLALTVKDQFADLGTWGREVGPILLTTVTATSIVFEVMGPLLTKVALKRAGEINTDTRAESS